MRRACPRRRVTALADGPLWNVLGAVQDTGLLQIRDAYFPWAKLGLAPAEKYLNSGAFSWTWPAGGGSTSRIRSWSYLRAEGHEIPSPDSGRRTSSSLESGGSCTRGGTWPWIQPANAFANCRGRRAGLAQAIARPAVIHFVERPKPWEKDFSTGGSSSTCIYLDRTWWRGWRPGPPWSSSPPRQLEEETSNPEAFPFLPCNTGLSPLRTPRVSPLPRRSYSFARKSPALAERIPDRVRYVDGDEPVGPTGGRGALRTRRERMSMRKRNPSGSVGSNCVVVVTAADGRYALPLAVMGLDPSLPGPPAGAGRSRLCPRLGAFPLVTGER